MLTFIIDGQNPGEGEDSLLRQSDINTTIWVCYATQSVLTLTLLLHARFNKPLAPSVKRIEMRKSHSEQFISTCTTQLRKTMCLLTLVWMTSLGIVLQFRPQWTTSLYIIFTVLAYALVYYEAFRISTILDIRVMRFLSWIVMSFWVRWFALEYTRTCANYATFRPLCECMVCEVCWGRIASAARMISGWSEWLGAAVCRLSMVLK